MKDATVSSGRTTGRPGPVKPMAIPSFRGKSLGLMDDAEVEVFYEYVRDISYKLIQEMQRRQLWKPKRRK